MTHHELRDCGKLWHRGRPIVGGISNDQGTIGIDRLFLSREQFRAGLRELHVGAGTSCTPSVGPGSLQAGMLAARYTARFDIFDETQLIARRLDRCGPDDRHVCCFSVAAINGILFNL
jgi:hypothetical protein